MAYQRAFVLKPIIVSQLQGKASSSAIFLHGSCDSGQGVMNFVNAINGEIFTFPQIRVIYPTAPDRPYSLHQGDVNSVWFDRLKIDPNSEECTDSINVACGYLNDLIHSEVNRGIPVNRIVVGGFSMGGCLALHFGYRFQRKLAGVFALSSFLNTNSAVYQSLSTPNNEQLPPLFMCHGKQDELVQFAWGEKTFKNLQNLGVAGEFHSFPSLEHYLEQLEVTKLHSWIHKVLPNHKL